MNLGSSFAARPDAPHARRFHGRRRAERAPEGGRRWSARPHRAQIEPGGPQPAVDRQGRRESTGSSASCAHSPRPRRPRGRGQDGRETEPPRSPEPTARGGATWESTPTSMEATGPRNAAVAAVRGREDRRHISLQKQQHGPQGSRSPPPPSPAARGLFRRPPPGTAREGGEGSGVAAGRLGFRLPGRLEGATRGGLYQRTIDFISMPTAQVFL